MSHPLERCRVLVITATFPPDGAVGNLRTLRLLKHLAESGAEQEVLTIPPDSYRAGTVIDADRLAQVPSGVRITHVRALRPLDRLQAALMGRSEWATGAGVGRPRPAALRARQGRRSHRAKRALGALLALPDPEVSWILPAILRGLRRARAARPDVIYSSGPPFSAHVVAAVLATLLKIRWVADFRDPWARAPWREDRFAFEKRAWSILERWIVNRADDVLFATAANRNDFAAEYGEAIGTRFHVVPNGCDPAEFEGLVPALATEHFVLLHAGSLYGARDPSPVFKAVARAVAAGTIDPQRFRLRLIGRVGVAGTDLPRLLRELGIEELVEFVPHLPRRQVLQRMVDASALLVVQPITKLSVPGKLYEYLAAGRPILALAEPDGETAAVLRQTAAGVVVAPDDGEGLLRALTDLVAGGHRRVETERTLFDGALRAREIARILVRVVSPIAAERTSGHVVSVTSRRR